MPLWWAFEGINYYTQNWQYLGAEEYSALRYFLVASWHFSIVIPAVFETAELVGSSGLVNRFRHGPALPNSWMLPVGAMVLGLASLALLVLWPKYAFAGSWLCLFLLLDPINYLQGRPSVLAWLGRPWYCGARVLPCWRGISEPSWDCLWPQCPFGGL